jgi:hypothetical protein
MAYLSGASVCECSSIFYIIIGKAFRNVYCLLLLTKTDWRV